MGGILACSLTDILVYIAHFPKMLTEQIRPLLFSGYTWTYGVLSCRRIETAGSATKSALNGKLQSKQRDQIHGSFLY
jgi:hypothetical protein